MTHLYVSVRLHGIVVEQRLLPIVDGLRLGESPDAAIRFPGADLLLRVVDGRLRVRGRELGVGDTLGMELGPVSLHLEAHDCAYGLTWLSRRLENALGGRPTLPDARLLLASAAIALGAASADAMTRFVRVDPVASAQVQAWRDAFGPTDARNAQIEAPEQPATPEPEAPPLPRDAPSPPVGFQP